MFKAELTRFYIRQNVRWTLLRGISYASDGALTSTGENPSKYSDFSAAQPALPLETKYSGSGR